MLARALLKYSSFELSEILTGTFPITFDDGITLNSTAKEAIYSSYFWEFHRQYPNTPLLSGHHVSSILKGKPLTSSTHIDLLQIVYWDTVFVYGNWSTATLVKVIDENLRNELTKLVFRVTNMLYNDVSHLAEDSVMSIDVLDFIEVSSHPAVEKAFETISEDTESIGNVYKEIMEVVENDLILATNSLVKATKAKMVNKNQVLQCIGPRGFVSEVDGAIMPVPVTRSYTQGMRTIYNTIAESRTAAKSYYFSEAPLQDSEYFARKLQFIAMSVERLAKEDCGSTNYINWLIKPEEARDGRVVFAGDLKYLVGKYYLDEKTNQLKILNISDTHLIGTMIKMRTALYCNTANPREVCQVCFGDMSKNIMPYANLGHVCSATMTQQSSQSVLSIKHLDSSSISDPINFTPELLNYFVSTVKGNIYCLDPKFKETNTRIIISRLELPGLTDILLVDDVAEINPSRVSSIKSIGIATSIIDSDSPIEVNLSQGGRNVLLTSEFLEYIKIRGWEINSLSAFVFDLDGWDFSLPIFRLPNMEYSFSKHSKAMASIIESRMENLTERTKPESPVRTLVELFDLVNSKINVNIALLEILIYSMMCKDIENKDYRLGRNSSTLTLGVSSDIMANRSLSAAYGYEGQGKLITSPKSFFSEGRPDSIFDVFIAPHEVLANRNY